VGTIVCGVEIRDELMAEAEELFGDFVHYVATLPRLFTHKVGVRGMKTVYGAEYSVLKPAEIKLVVLYSVHMSAYIM
jgi:hypothetical protein